MSLRCLIWAFDSDTKPSGKKFVLVALADAANERNKTFLSMPTLCKITAQSAVTVEANIAGLIEDGKIHDTSQRVGGNNEIRVFQLNCEPAAQPEQAALKAPKKERKRAPEMAEAYAIYDEYPRKVDPKKAVRAIAKAIKQYGFEIVMNGTKNFATAFKASGKQIEFCAHPATYFNNDRFTARLEDLGLPAKRNGAPDLTPHGPTAAEFQKHYEEKFGKEVAVWAQGFFARYQARKWMQNGRPIDWQIELSKHINGARTNHEKIKAGMNNPEQFPR